MIHQAASQTHDLLASLVCKSEFYSAIATSADNVCDAHESPNFAQYYVPAVSKKQLRAPIFLMHMFSR
jgi:hypothetical protein